MRVHVRPPLPTPALPLPLNVLPAASVQTMPWHARTALELGTTGCGGVSGGGMGTAAVVGVSPERSGRGAIGPVGCHAW